MDEDVLRILHNINILIIYVTVCDDRLWLYYNVSICYTFRCVHRGSKRRGCGGVMGKGLRPYKLRAMLSYCYFFRIKRRKCLIITSIIAIYWIFLRIFARSLARWPTKTAKVVNTVAVARGDAR